jgi:ubiquitin C-terminal hydrolase
MALCKLPQILCIQLVRFKKNFNTSQENPSTQEHSVTILTPTPTFTPNPISSTLTEDDTSTPTQTPVQQMFVEKIDTSIEVPTELDLTGLVSHPVKYDLLAVCNHHGSSPNSGHYTAFFLLGGEWWYASDETVRKAQSNEFEKITPTNSYILFYEQKEGLVCHIVTLHKIILLDYTNGSIINNRIFSCYILNNKNSTIKCQSVSFN